eukprot:TRINITY_DN1423_c0_g1_i5.p1 TRINITY_DN1423_c0_g1~~TRINITY_DN1423_c0_g1_i5.p1  ORF type:complete len:919 (+),score=331.64 TRINITY_DN1423_c0_g1_i5:79-2835(+)
MSVSASEEREQIKALHEKPLKEGDTWHLVDSRWWRMWVQYSGFESNVADEASRPGPIDNESLQGEKALELKADLTENLDYVLLSQEQWEKLVGWYGGGPDFPRKVIAIGLQRMCQIEMYPVILQVVRADAESGEPLPDTAQLLLFSKRDSLKSVLESLAAESADSKEEAKNVEAEWRVWLKEGEGWKLAEANQLALLLESFDFPYHAPVLVEKKRPDGSFPRKVIVRAWNDFRVGDRIDAKDTQGKWFESTVKEIRGNEIYVHFEGWSTKWDSWFPKDSPKLAAKGTYTNGPYVPRTADASSFSSFSSYPSYSSYSSNQEGAPVQKGAVGLRNLGNTCFMNSVLQCVAQTPYMTEFFLSRRYLAEVNRENPLGWQGKIAEEWGKLVTDMFSGKYSVVAPSALKQVVGQFQPRFSGFQQQDSSEFLSFLLDGLHEDLNRVHAKPATSAVESNGRPDEEVAAEAWRTHLLRNQSVITDVLQGQLKSTVVCPECSKVSITFDPFMFLSVPLPSISDRSQEVRFFNPEEAKVNLVSVNVPKVGIALDLKRAVSTVTQARLSRVVLCDIWNNRIFRIFADDAGLSEIRANDQVWAWQLPEVAEAKDNGPAPALLPLFHSGKRKNPRWSTYSLLEKEYIVEAFGHPLLLNLPARTPVSRALIHQRVAEAVTPFLLSGENIDPQAAPYKILLMDQPGRSCGKCSYLSMCAGCELPNDEKEMELVSGRNKYQLQLVWPDVTLYNTQKVQNIAPEVGVAAAGPRRAANSFHINECIAEFTKQETLSENDAWFCPSCRKFQCASKKFDIWKTPDILIVHLKRFAYTRYLREKIGTLVECPVEGLNIRPFLADPTVPEEDCIYDLFGVSNHMGGMGGGHYTAYTKNLVDGRWFELDDSRVASASAGNVVSPAAYVLFYSRRNMNRMPEN